MQTILGANGQIATELARTLYQHHTGALRLVSRNPRKVNEDDTLMAANLLDAGQTTQAVKGSRIVYFTAGLPPDSKLWEEQFPVMLRNALQACRAAGASFAYFDNTYMYPQNSQIQTEETCFAPIGRKGRVRGNGLHGVGRNGTRRHSRADRPRTGILWTGKNPELHQRPDH
nr:NAD(P)H-binding protein [Komagataeibacter rhaeticus]